VWFIKNYMSPQMRAFVPRMAAHYGFDYEFVTYKWPSWLHKQVRAQGCMCFNWFISAVAAGLAACAGVAMQQCVNGLRCA
jgi:hypothetical protein